MIDVDTLTLDRPYECRAVQVYWPAISAVKGRGRRGAWMAKSGNETFRGVLKRIDNQGARLVFSVSGQHIAIVNRHDVLDLYPVEKPTRTAEERTIIDPPA